MTLTSIKVGVLPYEDGSGYRFDMHLDDEGKLWVHQGGDSIRMDREESRVLVDAILALWATADQVSKTHS